MVDLQLRGRRAIVTGSSSGLGAAIAARFVEEGAGVVIHGRDEDRVRAVVQSLGGASAGVTAAVGDLSDDDGAEAAAAAALADGPIDILVNNAGFYAPGTSWWSATAADWTTMYQTNVVGSVRMIKALVPAMRVRGWGRVIQIGSTQGADPMAGQPHYGSTNAARENLARSLARELRHTGVTSNTVVAGGILSAGSKSSLLALGEAKGWGGDWAEIQRKATDERMPNDAGGYGTPEDYAALVAFIASPLAGYITGAALAMDGGWYDVPREASGRLIGPA